MFKRAKSFIVTFLSAKQIGAKSILNDFALVLITQVGTLVFSFILTLFLARSLGVHEYGTYAYVMAIISLAGMPAQFGFPTLVMRETASRWNDGNNGIIFGMWKWVFQRTIVLSLIVITIIFLLVRADLLRLPVLEPDLLLFGLIIVPIMALVRVSSGILRGLRRPILGQLPEGILPGIMLLLLLLLMSYGELGSYEAVLSNIISAVFSFFLGILLLRHITSSQDALPIDNKQKQYWWRAVVPLAFVGGIQYLNKQLDILMIGFFLQQDAVGLYKVATQLVIPISFILNSVIIVIAPILAEQYKSANNESLQRLVVFTARLTSVLSIPLISIIIFFNKELVSFVFGESYLSAAMPLSILLLGHLINTLAGPVIALLNMTGHEKSVMNGVAIGLMINIVLNLILIPIFGISGAAWATTVTFVVWNLILWIFALRRLGIDTSVVGHLAVSPQK